MMNGTLPTCKTCPNWTADKTWAENGRCRGMNYCDAPEVMESGFRATGCEITADGWSVVVETNHSFFCAAHPAFGFGGTRQ